MSIENFTSSGDLNRLRARIRCPYSSGIVRPQFSKARFCNISPDEFGQPIGNGSSHPSDKGATDWSAESSGHLEHSLPISFNKSNKDFSGTETFGPSAPLEAIWNPSTGPPGYGGYDVMDYNSSGLGPYNKTKFYSQSGPFQSGWTRIFGGQGVNFPPMKKSGNYVPFSQLKEKYEVGEIITSPDADIDIGGYYDEIFPEECRFNRTKGTCEKALPIRRCTWNGSHCIANTDYMAIPGNDLIDPYDRFNYTRATDLNPNALGPAARTKYYTYPDRTQLGIDQYFGSRGYEEISDYFSGENPLEGYTVYNICNNHIL